MVKLITDLDDNGQVVLWGNNDSEVFEAYDYAEVRQTHVYAGGGDDVINMYFGEGNFYRPEWVHQHEEYQGHHVRGGAGADIFNFASLSSVTGTVIGRIEDFDASRDELQIEGDELTTAQLANGSGQTAGYNWKIVEWNGDYNDTDSHPQQWLLIDTGAGWVFYTLEGARVDLQGDGAALEGEQEGHFFTNAPPNFAAMPAVSYVDPVNVVPAGYSTASGIVYNDVDVVGEDATDVIQNGATMMGHNDDASDDIMLDLSGNDLIAAGLNNDTVLAGAGDDTVWGGSGHDTIDGGTGDDLIFGGTGNDEISGGADNDVLHGEDGSDQIYGGASNDWLFGGSGNDTLYGAVGEDNLRGEDGNDTLRGHAGDDDLRGGAGEDVLYGNSDNDTLRGGADRDELYGGNGNDLLDGQTGHDRLDGGSGDDIMTGGSGRDVFVFDDNFGTDTITDFDFTANEVLDFSDHSGISSMTDLAITYVGSDTVITFGSDSVTLEGTTVILQVDDFIF